MRTTTVGRVQVKSDPSLGVARSLDLRAGTVNDPRHDAISDLSPPNLLNVQTLDHVVYLSGLVSSGLQRDNAEEVAREASDGARIVDTISVIQ